LTHSRLLRNPFRAAPIGPAQGACTKSPEYGFYLLQRAVLQGFPFQRRGRRRINHREHREHRES